MDKLNTNTTKGTYIDKDLNKSKTGTTGAGAGKGTDQNTDRNAGKKINQGGQV